MTFCWPVSSPSLTCQALIYYGHCLTVLQRTGPLHANSSSFLPLLQHLVWHLAGETFGADGDAATSTAMKAIQDAAAEEAKQRLAEKAAKKAAFNAEYDVGELVVLSAALCDSLGGPWPGQGRRG